MTTPPATPPASYCPDAAHTLQWGLHPDSTTQGWILARQHDDGSSVVAALDGYPHGRTPVLAGEARAWADRILGAAQEWVEQPARSGAYHRHNTVASPGAALNSTPDPQADRSHRTVLTVAVTSRPDGGHYIDQADFTAHVAQWLKTDLKGHHAIAEVTVDDQAAELARAQAEAHQYRTALQGVARKAAVPVAVPPAGQADEERARISAKLWAVAEHHIIAEWICCEPLEPKHTLCAKGYAALSMARSLLVDADPEEAWNPNAPLLDAVLSVLPDTARLHDEILTLRADQAKMRDLLRSENEASRRLLEQRQEMAEERYAWQERGDRAEERVRKLEAGQAALSDTDRKFLAFALDLAADQMASRGDEFDPDDEDAMERLRRLAAETPRPETQAVRHAPGTAILCPDCRAKGHSICITDGEQQPETQACEETGSALARYIVEQPASVAQAALRVLGFPPLRMEFELADDPATPPAVVAEPGKEQEAAPVVRCSLAILSRPHAAHGWEPQSGMDPVHCPGHTFTEEN